MSSDHVWLKGVPMELRPRYFPKPPLRFKDIDIYIPLDAIENDYDFTEERRVLAECKMWVEEKEKERLAREEEERIREIADAEERLRLEEQERLEREEAEAAGIAALAAQAELELQQSKLQPDQEISASSTVFTNSLMNEQSGKLDLNDHNHPSALPPQLNNLDNSLVLTDDSPQTIIGNNVGSAGSSHQESPSSEDNSTSSQSHNSQSQPVPLGQVPQDGDSVGVVQAQAGPPMMSPPTQQTPYPLINGYQYMHPLYHHPQYYSYYMTMAPAPSLVGPSPPQQYPQASHIPPQANQNPGSSIMYQQPQLQQQNFQPSPLVSAPPAPPPTGTGMAVVQTPTSSSSAAVTPSGTTAGGGTGGESSASGTSTPTGDSSEKSVSTSNSANVLNSSVSKKVDLKDLSDFESDTANPFDNVELKSINDMEVLASVLKNHVSPTPTGGEPQQSSQSRSASTGSTPSSYGHTNGGVFYHQPTPIYPPVSSQQCPYPQWNPQQNGYYQPASATSTSVSNAVVVPPPTSIAPPQPSLNSHIPSPTQAMEQQQPPTTIPNSVNEKSPLAVESAANAVNSFTKLTFPFLTSIDASSSRYPRNSYMSSSSGPPGGATLPSAPVPTPQHSQDDITSQNPFLSRYVQSTPLQHQHRHQYWPTSSQLPAVAGPHQQQPHGIPYSATPLPNGGTGVAVSATGPLVHHQLHHHLTSAPNSTTGPSSTTAAAGSSRHALR